MTKRKKRLEKGINSMKEQIELHFEKKKKAEDEKDLDLVNYYEKEILVKKKTLEERKKILDKN
jgi:hypothetical protein